MDFLRRHPLWLFSFATLVSLLLGELGSRHLGLRPFHPNPPNVEILPPGPFFERDPLLGYRMRPGKFEVTLFGPQGPHQRLEFTLTHGADSLRRTGPQKSSRARPGIWIFGCSITYGWSVTDEATYPWLLQQEFPHYEVRNFGVSGYDTLRSYLQLKEAIRFHKPAVVVISYGTLHDDRNTNVRRWQKRSAPMNRLGLVSRPVAFVGSSGELAIETEAMGYEEFPLMRWSALVHGMENLFNRLEAHWSQSRKVTVLILNEARTLTEKHGVPLVVAGISPDDSTRQFLKERADEGFTVVDISAAGPDMTNEPFDGHPSARANLVFAEKLGRFLRSQEGLGPVARTSSGL